MGIYKGKHLLSLLDQLVELDGHKNGVAEGDPNTTLYSKICCITTG